MSKDQLKSPQVQKHKYQNMYTKFLISECKLLHYRGQIYKVYDETRTNFSANPVSHMAC